MAENTADATASARETVADYWDNHATRWLAGEDPLPEPLLGWFNSYRGDGAGTATRDGLIEPYTGDLRGRVRSPRVVMLALHAGEYYPALQARDGAFADEVRAHGSYSAWATTGPYLRKPWTSTVGPNRYQRACLSFTQRWLEEPTATHHDMLIFEMYPWHATIFNAGIRVPAGIIDQFVWRPVAELPVRYVFAFGRAWDELARELALPLTESLGRGGRPYGSTVSSRAVRVYALPSGQKLVVEWHQGAISPPSAAEVTALRTALV